MMKCDEFIQWYGDYAEGRVPFTTSMSMKLHLVICKHCARYYAQMGQVVALTAEHRAALGLNDDVDETLSGEAREDLLAAFRDRDTG